MSEFSAFKPHKTKHCCIKNENSINHINKKINKLEKKIKVLEENNLEDDFEDTYDKLESSEINKSKLLKRNESPTGLDEIFDENKEFMGGRKRKTKKGGVRTVRREPKSNNNINQRLVDEYISELENRNPRRRANPYYPQEISDEVRNRLINENGYYRGIVHNSGVMADEMVYEYMNYPCYTPCKKQGVCDKIFGCGPDKCRPADATAIGPDSMIWRRCIKPSTRRRGGKSKTKKRKTKKRKNKKRKTKTRKNN